MRRSPRALRNRNSSPGHDTPRHSAFASCCIHDWCRAEATKNGTGERWGARKAVDLTERRSALRSLRLEERPSHRDHGFLEGAVRHLGKSKI